MTLQASLYGSVVSTFTCTPRPSISRHRLVTQIRAQGENFDLKVFFSLFYWEFDINVVIGMFCYGILVEPSEKSVEIMRKFSEQYARKSDTYFCVDKSVTSVVIKVTFFFSFFLFLKFTNWV